MPTTLTLKNIPDFVYDRLKLSAEAHRRSMNSEAIVCLEAVLLPAKVTPAEEGVYGGVYAIDCNNINALRVRLYGDVMTVERAGKAVSAKPFKSSKTAPSGSA